MKISVFGGSKPQAGEPAYEEAFRLGVLLAQAGHTVQNGGYSGTMEAVSKGAASQGGKVIGVTCTQIEAWRPIAPNAWLSEVIRYETLEERLLALIKGCDAAIALPGGPGTLTEISVMWNLLLTESISARPLIAVGPGWRATFEHYYVQLGSYVPESQRRWLHLAEDIESALRLLEATPGASMPAVRF